MTALEKEKKYTSDEFLAMTDLKGNYELIDGIIYDMSPGPSIRHQDLFGGLYLKIGNLSKGFLDVYLADL